MVSECAYQLEVKNSILFYRSLTLDITNSEHYLQARPPEVKGKQISKNTK
jgi:hypothetical protein